MKMIEVVGRLVAHNLHAKGKTMKFAIGMFAILLVLALVSVGVLFKQSGFESRPM
jgi:hypothetical protein